MGAQTPEVFEQVTPIILAGGMGLRLRGVWDGPTVLVPVGRPPLGPRPIVTYLLDRLIEQGFQHAILALGHKGAQVERSLGTVYHLGFTDQTPMDLLLEYVYEDAPLGTAGAVRNVVDQIDTKDHLLVMYGNTFNALDLKDFWEWYRRWSCEAGVGMHVITTFKPREGSIARVSADRHVVEYHPRGAPATAGGALWADARMYLIPRASLLESILGSTSCSIQEDFLLEQVDRLNVWAYRRNTTICDVATPERLAFTRCVLRGLG